MYKRKLISSLLLKKFDQLKHFLGLKVDQIEEWIFLCQQKYANNLLKKFRMVECKPISTPMKVNAKLFTHKGIDL